MPVPPTAAKREPRSGNDLLRVAVFSRGARRAWCVLLLVLLALVLYGALSPHPHGPSLRWDKANHAVAFASLAFSALLALRERPRHVPWIAVSLFALGVAIEIAQAWVPGRTADAADVLANSVGIALGLAFGSALARVLERRRAPRTARPAARRRRN